MLTRLDVRIAERSWVEFFQPMFGPLEPIVRDLIALPSGASVEQADPRPPIVFHSLEGVVRGQRYRIVGTKADGLWAEIIEAQPL